MYDIFSNKFGNYKKMGRIVIDNVENNLNYRKMDRIRDYEVLNSEELVIKFLFICIHLKRKYQCKFETSFFISGEDR